MGTGGDDLWVASVSGGQIMRLTSGNLRPQQIQWSKRFPDRIYFRDGEGVLRIVRLGVLDVASMLAKTPGAATGQAESIPFKVKMTVRRDEEYGEMLEQAWRALAENFYDAKFHGVDMEALRAKYRPLVKHVTMREDLYALVQLMLGELNASHLGITGFIGQPDEQTADLGLIFNEAYRGPGLQITEVLKRGPADRRGLNLRAGDIIVAVDGTELSEQTELSTLLAGKIDEPVTLQVTSSATADPKDPKARRRVEVRPANRHQIHELMYERWTSHNAKRVAELSKGRLGYIHIPSMDEAGLEKFVRALYSDNTDKDAIVLDVRFNGGGFTHDQVLNYLGAKVHTLFRNRDGGEGMVMRSYDRKWTKPLVLLINNRSFSDAEIFPNAFRTLGLGKLVGQPTGGHVIGTMEIELIDGSSFRIPRIGVYTASGVNMEKEGVAPDVLVEPNPDLLAKGEDIQVDKAVEVLMQDVAAWKKSNPAIAGKSPEGKSTPTVAAPVPPTMPPAAK
jgi:tricorn protease